MHPSNFPKQPLLKKKSIQFRYPAVLPGVLMLLIIFWQNDLYAQCDPYIDPDGAGVPLSVADTTTYNLGIWAGTGSMGLTAGTWAGWANAINGSASAAQFKASAEGAGQYNISWTVVNPDVNCLIGEVAYDTLYVDGDNSNLMPGLTASSNVTCANGQVQITATSTDSTFSTPAYNYSINMSSTSAGASVNANGLVTAGSPGTIQVDVTETSAFGTSMVASVTITVNSAPDVIVSGSPATVCADIPNSGVVLSTSYSPPGDVDYTISNIISNTNINALPLNTVVGTGNNVNMVTPDLSNTDTDGSVTYEITPVLNDGSGCTGNPMNISIDVEAIPTVSANPATTAICDGGTTSVTLTTTYNTPADVTFWIVDIDDSAAPHVSGIALNEGPVGGGMTSTFVDGDMLMETLSNNGSGPETVVYSIAASRTDGNQCIGDTIQLPVSVNPAIQLNSIRNELNICGGEKLDFDITTNISGNGVTFDLIIKHFPDMPANFPGDLSDDNTFPILIPNLSVNNGGVLNTTTLNTQINNSTGTFDRGRVIIGFQNIRLTDVPVCTIPDIPPMTGAGNGTRIYPTPDVTDPADETLCSGDTFNKEIDLINVTSSNPSNAGFPVRIDWTVTTTTNDGGISGAANGSKIVYDAAGLETPGFDISQTLSNNGNNAETATYTVTPRSAGPDGTLGNADDCIGSVVSFTITVEPEPAMNFASQTIATNTAFNLTLTAPTQPSQGAGDVAFFLTAISMNNVNAGNAVTPGSTVVINGGTFSETLTNNTNTTQSVDYFFRPQLNSSRTNAADPNTATCTGMVAAYVTVNVLPTPDVVISGGNLNPPDEDLICNGDNSNMTISTNTTPNPFDVGFRVSSRNATNVSAPVLFAVGDVVGFNSVSLQAPVLTDNTQPGEVTYEFTPFIDLNGNGDFDTGEPTGNPESVRIVIEPEPVGSGPANPILLCQEDVTGNVGQDVNFTINSNIAPSINSFIRFTIDSVIIIDPNAMGGASITTTLEGQVNPPMNPDVNLDGTAGVPFSTMVQDAVMIGTPQNFMLPITISYIITTKMVGNNGAPVCSGNTFRTDIILQPKPYIEITPPGTIAICESDSVALSGNVQKNITATSDFTWTVISATAGVNASLTSTNSQNTTFTATVDGAVIPAGDSISTFVELTLTDGNGCMDFDTIEILVVSAPVAENDTLYTCENTFGGNDATFDLTLATAVVTGGETGVTTSYHSTLADAENDVNPLSSPYNSIDATIHARVEDDTTGCVAFAEVLLVTNPLPVANPDTLFTCENAAGSNQGTFNLNDADGDVSDNASGVTITYHQNQTDADSGANALNSPYTATDNTTVIARVENDASACYNTSDVLLTVFALPATFKDTLTACEIVPGGLAGNFILEEADTTVAGGAPDKVVSYHAMQAEAVSGTNPLSSPYTAVSSTIYARVRDTLTNCFDTTCVLLLVDTMPTVFNDTLMACGNIFNANEADFILENANLNVTNGVSDLVVSYHETAMQANDSTNALISPYTNSTTTVYARVTDTITLCYDIAEVRLKVIDIPTVSPDTLRVCETTFMSGLSNFNLTDADATVSNGVAHVIVTYHPTDTAAANATDTLTSPFTSSDTIIYARIRDTLSGCVNIAPVHLEVIGLPAIMVTGIQMSSCISDPGFTLTGTPANGTFTIVPATAALLDNGNGTALFEPSMANLGRYDVTYTAADPATGCSNSVTVFFEVVQCSPIEITITDPCSCRENSPGSQGNATTLDNGQFSETITVSGALPGENWYIASVSGLFRADSPHPPAAPTPFITGPAGDTLVENPGGVYILDGIHVDSAGYTISVTNGTDTLSTSNICFYPTPVISSLLGAYCVNEAGDTLIGNVGPGDLDTFNIYRASTGLLLQSNVTRFDPGTLGRGNYEVEYILDERDTTACQNCNPGCKQAIRQAVEVVDPPRSLACNDLVHISLDSDCKATVGPDAVLEGNYDNYDIFNIVIYDGNRNIGDSVNGSHIGKILEVRAIDRCTGNYCWGNLTVRDKMPPQFVCSTDTIQVGCTANLDTIAAPRVVDNCQGPVLPQLVGETSTDFPCGRGDSTVKIIHRFWKATDRFNNTSATCRQIIKVLRRTLDEVVFPPDYDGVSAPSLDCSQPISDASPDNLGYPTVDGSPLLGGNLCMLNTSFTDDTLAQCGNSIKLLREWTLFDWCTPLQQGVNPLRHTQVILFEDTRPPAIVCPDTLIASAGQNQCTATVNFPAIPVPDDCSGAIVQIITPYGVIQGNGGTLSGFPLGEYLITYAVRDSCGNDTSCVSRLIVIDDVEPIAICKEFLAVSLTNNGEATVQAADFDGNSFDNCCLDRFEVKRMGEPDSAFDSEITFTCADAGDSVNVIIRVYDCTGLYNECMVVANVSEKLAPTLICPNHITIGCQDPISTSFTGNARAFDGCPIAQLNFTDTDNRNDCGVGQIIRTFRATDVSGNSTTCSQIITVINDNPFDSTTIVWPRDTTFLGACGQGLHPDSLPSGYDRPVYPNTFCAEIWPNYEDKIFDRVQGACFKLRRTWTLINECVYDPNSNSNDGIYTHVQTIKVIDNTDPVLFCPDSIVAYTGSDCLASVVIDTPLIVDCTPNPIVELSGDLGTTFGTIDSIVPGDYSIMITVNDRCNNITTCSIPVLVRDTLAPTAICQPLAVPLDSFGIATVPARFVDGGSFDNCSGVTFSYSLNPNDTIRHFTCAEIGANTVSLYVSDADGNVDFCIDTITIQDNNDVCDDGSKPYLAGGIKTSQGRNVAAVKISLSGSSNQSVTTGNNGVYKFENLESGRDYSLVPLRDDDILNGVTTFDLAMITKHILNVQPFTSPYQIIAADANNTNTITTLDVVVLRKIILRIANKLPNNTSWRFVRADFEFPDPSNPWKTIMPEIYSVNNIQQAIGDIDFIAIKIGDVNGNAQTSTLNTATIRSAEPELNFSTENATLKSEEVWNSFITPEAAEPVLAYQFTIRFDTDKLELGGIRPTDGMSAENFGLTQLDHGVITVSWHNTSAASPPAFELEWIAKKPVTLNTAIRIDGSYTFNEAYYTDGTVLVPKLKFNPDPVVANPPFHLYQNQPNPFEEETVIRFSLPARAYATLQIFDIAGTEIKSISDIYDRGMNEVRIRAGDLSAKGIFYYRLRTDEHSGVKKMIRMK